VAQAPSNPQPPLQTLFAATPAQIASLHNLEQQAIQNTVTDHSLPASDFDAAATWGRQDAIGELFGEIEQAIQTPAISRTVDMANAVQWVTSVLQRYQTLGAQYAGYEFLKWAGDPRAYNGSYWTFVNSGPSEQAMESYFTSGQENEYLNDAKTGAPIPGWGYCGYQPPSGGSAYTAPGSPCYVPCQSVAGCLPFPPTYNTFVAWGQNDLVNSLLALPNYNTQEAGIAAGIGLGTAAALALGVASVVGASIAIGGTGVAGGLLGAIWPVTVGATVGTSSLAAATVAEEGAATLAAASSAGALLGPILVVVGGIVAGAFFAVDLYNAYTLVPQLATTIADAPTTPYDVSGVLSDKNKLSQLFSLLVGASLPVPSLTTCTDILPTTPITNPSILNISNPSLPCLNAPPIPAPAQTDYQFAVSAQGASTSIVTRTLTWVDNTLPAAPITNSARLSGNWFVETQTDSNGASAPIQTLVTHRVDWAGTPWLTELLPDPTTGNPMFASVKGSGQQGYSLDVNTCASDNTCTLTDTIQFVGTDGKDYTATLVPPRVPLVEATVVTQNPQIGSPVAFDASRSHSPVGLPLTVTWQFPVPDSTCTIVFGVSGPPCIGGIEYESPVTGTQATYTFSDIGTYNVLVTAVDSTGESTTLTLPVNVSPTAAEAPHITIAPACPVASGSCNSFTIPPGQPTTLNGSITHTYHSVGELNDSIDWGDGTQTSGYAAVFNLIPIECVSSCPPQTSTDSFVATHTYTATGTYTVTVSDSGPFGATSVTTTEVVKPAPLTVTADNQSMTYGGALPTFTASYSGFLNGDTSSALSGTLACATIATSSSPIGTYPITCGGQTGTSYTITYVTGTLTINTAPLTVTADNQSMSYGGTLPTFTASYSGLVGGDTAAGEQARTVCASSPATPVNVATYPITCTLTDPNYSPITTMSGTLTINTVPLTVTADNQRTVFGQTFPPFTVTPNGLVNGDTLSSLLGTLAVTTTATPSSAPGTYTLTPSGLSSPNYYLAFETGSLVISKDAPTVALASSASAVPFGQTVVLTATVGAAAPGSGTPTGLVTFLDGSTPIGTATLTNGTASLGTATLLGGTHALSASYAGDGDFEAGASTALTQTITFGRSISGSVSGAQTIKAGEAVLINGTVNGSITVQAGGALALVGAHINGPLKASGAASIVLCGSTVGGPLAVSGSTGLVRIGAGLDDPGVSCGPDSIQGALSLSGNKGGVEVEGANIAGPLTLTNNTAGPTAGADSTAPEIEGNTIAGTLGCSGDSPAPASDGYPNTATGPKSGQCSVAGM
jgi:hypothetical protein